jgi:AraC-like DNA-binding protein
MYVDTELVSRMVLGITSDTQHQPFFPDAMVFDDDILRNYRRLCYSFEESATTLERESLLLEILILLVDRHAEERVRVRPPQKERKAVERVREFIAEFHARNISLQELSSLVDFSPFHLTRVFTKEIGMPPHAFLNQVRVVNAKRLIRNGLPLSDVAVRIGFADQSHFIRHFKRLMKITPGEYMKSARTFYTSFSPSV